MPTRRLTESCRAILLLPSPPPPLAALPSATAGDGFIDVVTANDGADAQVFWGDGSGNKFTVSTATLNSVIDTRPTSRRRRLNAGVPGGGGGGGGGGDDDGGIPAESLTGHKTLELFDYDGDGVLDVILGWAVLKSNGDRTFTGDAGPGFTETKCILVTANNDEQWDCTEPNSISIGDYDADGDLDLFISMPNGKNNELWRNEGNGVFDLVQGQVSALSVESVASTWVDMDGARLCFKPTRLSYRERRAEPMGR